MNNEKTKVSVVVAGQRFTLLTEKTEKYVIELADRIDARINSLILSGEMTRERAAVLTALDFADDNENDKDTIRAVKEQIKDYLSEIERLQGDRTKLSADYTRLKEEYERLIAERTVSDEAQTALEESREQVADLTQRNAALETELTDLRAQMAAITAEKDNEPEPEIPLPQDAPEEKEAAPPASPINADDDLPFDEPEEPVVKPQKKKRHEHKHVNPYQKRAAEQKEQKGYTPQRQYTFFDLDEQ